MSEAGRCRSCWGSGQRSWRGLTSRHLSEYTHLEAELVFIEFKDLLDHLEDLVRPYFLASKHS